jgi:hypothetical protein
VYALQVEPLAPVTTDASGRFRLPLPGSEDRLQRVEGLRGLGYAGASEHVPHSEPRGSWYVHAALPGLATVTCAPFQLVLERPPELELRLPPSGTIAGRLVLPRALSPSGWTAWASDGLAEHARASVAADGAFEFTNLHPGGWQVRVFEPGQRFYPEGGRIVTERVPIYDVEVEAGRTSTVVHTAEPRARARLSGRLWIDGEPPGPAFVSVRTATPVGSITSHETTLDPDGRFEVALEAELSTSILVQLTRGSATWSVSAKVNVAPGPNEWSLELGTARLAGELELPTLDESSFLGNQPLYEQELDHARVQVRWRPDGDGFFGPIVVPAGRGVLRGPQRDFRRPGDVLVELELAPGETRRVGLAQR